MIKRHRRLSRRVPSKNETSRVQTRSDCLATQMMSVLHGRDHWLTFVMDEMKENRATIQKLQERVILLESKVRDVQDQLKQFQDTAVAVAFQHTLMPPAAVAFSASSSQSDAKPVPALSQVSETPARSIVGTSVSTGSKISGMSGIFAIPSTTSLSASSAQSPLFGPTSSAIRLTTTSTQTTNVTNSNTKPSFFTRVSSAIDIIPSSTQTLLLGSIFSAPKMSASTTQSSLFSAAKVTTSSTQIQFGSTLSSTALSSTGSPPPIFGSTYSTTRFSAYATQPPIFVSVAFSTNVTASSSQPFPIASTFSTVSVSPSTVRTSATTTSNSSSSNSSSAGTTTTVFGGFTFRQALTIKVEEKKDCPDAHFEPAVALPEVVDLRTGEEDEAILFADRVKLYRITGRQWNERRVGTLKILFNESTVRARILMRCEKIHKICANHYIKLYMTVEKKSPEDVKVLTWKAVDCSDEEPRLERFCCKFKTVEVADQFVENINKAKKLIADGKQALTLDNQKTNSEVSSATSVVSATSVAVQPSSAFSVATLNFTSASGQTPKFSFGISSSSSTPFSSNAFRPPLSTTAAQQPSLPALVNDTSTGSIVGSSGSLDSKTSGMSGIFAVSSTTCVVASSGQSSLFVSTFSAIKATTSDTQSVRFESSISTTNAAISSTKPPLFAPVSSATDVIPSSTQTLLFGSIFSAPKISASSTQSSLFSAATVTTSSTQIQFGSTLSSTALTSTGSPPPIFGSTYSTTRFSTSATQPPIFGSVAFSTNVTASTLSTVSVSASTKTVCTSIFSTGTTTSEKQEVTFPPLSKATQPIGSSKWPAAGQDTLTQILSETIYTEINESKPAGTTSATSEIFGSTTSSVGLSFRNLSVTGTQGFVTKKVDADVFNAKGQRLFEDVKNLEKVNEDGNDDGEEEYVPNRSFEALVSLPEVEVVTGEENETKLFGERAKLYRMDNESKQWKERGVGEIKILKNAVSMKFRILMRREQVLKVCANHYITTKMKLLPMKTSESSWCWFARDFSEEEMHEEQLCVKFKMVEQAENFKRCFEDCQKKLAESASQQKLGAGSKTRAANIDETETSTSENKSAESSSSLSNLFKPKEGEWQCEACYVRNSGDKAKCVACETQKPSSRVEAVPTQPKIEDVGSISSSLSSLFKTKDGEWQCEMCYVKNDSNKAKCVACETPKPGAPVEQLEMKPSAQLKLGPDGGFTFGADKLMSFTGGFGSTTHVSDSEKKTDAVDFMPKPTGFGHISSGFGSFTFGNTKAVETKPSSDVVDSSVVTSSSQPGSEDVRPFRFGQMNTGFGTPIDASKNSDDKDQQSAAGTGKENAKPLFGTTSTAVSKSAFTFSGFGGVSSPASFTFGGKGFSMGLSNAPQTTEKPLDVEPSSTSMPKNVDPKNVDSSLPGSGTKPVFSNFSFVPSAVASPSETATDSQSKTIADDSSHKIFGSGFSFTGVSSGTAKPAVSTTLATPNKTAFSAISPASPQSPDGLYKNSEGEDDHIVFEPIVRLPENVEVRTGEEDEKVLYSQRAKLYRFIGNEWKERGVGDVKILQHKDTQQVRLLMRRERVLKICMNHRLAPEMSLKQMPNAQGKVLMWHAEDFADGESIHEKFSVRFKDARVASDFEAAFNRALDHVKSTKEGGKKVESLAAAVPETVTSTSQALSSNSSGKSLLLNLLKKPASSSTTLKVASECEVVSVKEPSAELVEKAQQLQLSTYFYNYMDAAQCPGCIGCDPDSFDFSTIGQCSQNVNSASRESGAPAQQRLVFGGVGGRKDFSNVSVKAPTSVSMQQEASKTVLASSASSKFVFGSSSSVPSFAALNAQQPASVSTTVSKTFSTPSTSSKFVFGSSSSVPSFAALNAQQPASVSTTGDMSRSGFVFGSNQSVDFAALAATNSSASGFVQSKPDPNFKWEGAGSQLFGGTKGQTDGKNEDADEDGSEGDDQEEENSGIHFTPIVQLPEVEVKTGEEDEDELFRERAKLYRFDNGQWKERGVGEMKILRHHVNGTYRLLLRREQVHKVACNHLLTVDMKLQPQRMTENTWCWFAHDFAEGDAKMEQFALRFKTSELANKFKDKFVECQNKIGRATLESNPGLSANASASLAPKAQQTGTLAESIEEKPSPAMTPSGTGHLSYRQVATNAENENEDSASATSQDEDDEEVALLFAKRATVKYRTNDNVFHEGGMVELVAMEDEDVCGVRLQMHKDNDEVICNHIICNGYEIKRTDQRYTCEWTAKDFSTDEPIRKTFQLTFCSMSALQEFERIFQNGVQLAVDSELSESKADEFYPRPNESDDSNNEDSGR